MTQRSALQHRHGHVGGDVLQAPDFGEAFEGAVRHTPGPAQQALLHSSRGHLHPSLGRELPEKAPVPSSSPAGGNQELHGAGSPASSAGRSPLGFLQLLASDDLEDEEFAPMYNCWRFLRHPSPAMLSLVLTGLITLSQRAQMVSRAESRAAMWDAHMGTG